MINRREGAAPGNQFDSPGKTGNISSDPNPSHSTDPILGNPPLNSKFPLPSTAFIHPQGENLEAIDRLVHRVVEMVLHTAADAGNRSPLPGAQPLPQRDDLPDSSVDEETLLADLQRFLHQSMNAAHPGYIGHMDPIASTMSIMGGLATASLNNNMLSLELSPVFSRLEVRLMARLARLFGLGDQSGGLLLSGGSLANLQAMAVARNTRFNVMESGLTGLLKKPVMFTSDVAHTSFLKAAMLLGLGTDAVIGVETNANSRMIPAALEEAILQAGAAGWHPFLVAATAGTTVTGSIDPLEEIGKVARNHGLWYHVDAAYGGALMMSDQAKHRLAGVELADSVTFNPQKWMYVTKVCATLMFKDMNVLEKGFRVQLPYMQNPEGFINFGEISVQGTRHPDVLKLWLTLQHLGRQGLGGLVDGCLELTTGFLERVKARPHLVLSGDPETNIVVFRGAPPWIDEDQWDDWNAMLQAALLEKGNTFLAISRYRGRKWLRAVLVNPYTTQETLDNLFTHLDGFFALSQEERR